MVSTRKKRQSNKRLLGQLDDFDQDMIIGNAVSERQENAVANEGTNDRNFAFGTFNNDSVTNGNAMSAKTLEMCFNERIDREMSNIIDTVEDRIQNAILTAIDNIVALKIELAIRSVNASSGRYVTSVSANSERREHVGINAPFENASGNNDTLDVSNVNDETRHNIPDEVSGLSVPETHFGRQPHTHHNKDTSFKHRTFFLSKLGNFFCYFTMQIVQIFNFNRESSELSDLKTKLWLLFRVYEPVLFLKNQFKLSSQAHPSSKFNFSHYWSSFFLFFL